MWRVSQKVDEDYQPPHKQPVSKNKKPRSKLRKGSASLQRSGPLGTTSSDDLKGMLNIDYKPSKKFQSMSSRTRPPSRARTLIGEGSSIANDERKRTAFEVPRHVEPYESNAKQHLQHHKQRTAEGQFRKGSILAPLYKQPNEIIDEYIQGKDGVQRALSYKEQYYKKQGERMLRRGSQKDIQDNVLAMFQNMNRESNDGNQLQLRGEREMMMDDPMAKYGLSGMITETQESDERYGFLKEQRGRQDVCVDCRRFQLKIRHLEKEMADYKKLQKQVKTLDIDKRELERLRKRIKAFETARDPARKLQEKVDYLERKQLAVSRVEDPIHCLEKQLQNATSGLERESNGWKTGCKCWDCSTQNRGT